MKKVNDMDREELKDILQGLFDNFNRYAKLYTLVEGEIYIHEAYSKILQKFGKGIEDYESQVLNGSSAERQKISEMQELNATAVKRAQKLSKKVNFEEGLIGDDGKEGLKEMAWGAVVVGVIFWIVYYFFPLAIIGVFAAIWFEFKIWQATSIDSHREQLKNAISTADSSAQQYQDLLTSAESAIWSAEYKAFCNQSENAQLVDQAKATTSQCLKELKSIDFNNYALLPTKFQDNVSVQKSLELLDTGQADSWKECAQIMAQENIQRRQFEEMKHQTNDLNQIISNQEQMINNQETQINGLNILNKNVQTINESISNLATTIEKQGTAVKHRLDVVAVNQGVQMFQAKEFHKEQLEAMRDSCDVIARRAYMSPAYYQYG